MIRWVAALGLTAGLIGAAIASPLTEREKTALLRHGPWPTPWAGDPSNRVSGQPHAIRFGATMFFEPRLSAAGDRACATCHQPDRGWTDGRAVAVGVERLDRNTLSLLNVREWRWFGWDGSHDTLWGQSLRPLLDPREMANTMAGAAALVRTDPALACGYGRSFGRSPGAVDDESLTVDLAKAMAAFQETLVSGPSPFDRFRDALAAGDAAGIGAYPEPALRGARLFVGKGDCAICHQGPGFTNREFHDTGVPFFARPGVVDSGRHGGIQRLRAGRDGLLGPFNDDPIRAQGLLSARVDLQHRNWGEFRVPGLRNVAQTAPYMHAGSRATLRDAIRHYSDLDEERLHADGERLLRPLRLSEGEINDLVAFLESLTGGSPELSVPANCD